MQVCASLLHLRDCPLAVAGRAFDELFETLTLVQTRKIKPIPIVLVGKEYWQQAFNVDFLVDEGVIDEEDRELFWYAETAQEIWDGILLWHEKNGTPLLPRG